MDDDRAAGIGARVQIVVLDDVEADVERRGTGGLHQVRAQLPDVVHGDEVPEQRVLRAHLALGLAPDLLFLLDAQRTAARDRPEERQQDPASKVSCHVHLAPWGEFSSARHWTCAGSDFFSVARTERMAERTASSKWTLSMMGSP